MSCITVGIPDWGIKVIKATRPSTLRLYQDSILLGVALISRSRMSQGDRKGKFFLMHGLGSDEQDMFGLAQAIDSGFEIVCLRAPMSYGPGFAWFEIAFSPIGIEPNYDQFWESVEVVADLLKAEDPATTIVGGFSQGAMMTAGLMVKHPLLFSKAVLLSGRGVGLEPGGFPGTAFQAHGQFDDVIPFRDGVQLRSELSQMGDRHAFHAYDMGHWVCEEEIDDLNAWLNA